MQQSIGFVSNYYGGVEVSDQIESGKYHWEIENYDGFEWEEIPKYLYDALLKFDNEHPDKIHLNNQQ